MALAFANKVTMLTAAIGSISLAGCRDTGTPSARSGHSDDQARKHALEECKNVGLGCGSLWISLEETESKTNGMEQIRTVHGIFPEDQKFNLFLAGKTPKDKHMQAKIFDKKDYDTQFVTLFKDHQFYLKKAVEGIEKTLHQSERDNFRNDFNNGRNYAVEGIDRMLAECSSHHSSKVGAPKGLWSPEIDGVKKSELSDWIAEDVNNYWAFTCHLASRLLYVLSTFKLDQKATRGLPPDVGDASYECWKSEARHAYRFSFCVIAEEFRTTKHQTLMLWNGKDLPEECKAPTSDVKQKKAKKVDEVKQQNDVDKFLLAPMFKATNDFGSMKELVFPKKNPKRNVNICEKSLCIHVQD